MIPAPVTVKVPPKEIAPVPVLPAKVILELARSPLATERSTMEAEFTDGVVIKPVPEATRKVAEPVLMAPMSKSSVMFRGEIAPAFLCQVESDNAEASTQTGVPDPALVKT